MRTAKRFLQTAALLFLTGLLLSCVLVHNVYSDNPWCLTCEGEVGGSSPAEHGNVKSISPAKPAEADRGTFTTHPYVKREDSRAVTFHNEKTEDSRTVTFPIKKTEDSRTVTFSNMSIKDSRNVTYPNMPKEDSRTFTFPIKKTEDSRTVTFSNMPKEDSRAYASPYMYTYNEIPVYLNYTPTAHHDVRRRKPGSKLILYWQHHKVFPITDDFNDLCRRTLSSPCEITFDERLHAKADAVVFHASRLFDPKPPFKKRRGQIWIARGLESPIHWNNGYRREEWRGKFNWTMTYRPDSEIFQPVGVLVEMPVPPDKDFREIAANKTRSVAWFVSDCRTVSRREEYVEQLKKHIDVDIYGSCGRLDCPKHGSVCDDMLSEKYRFYLSFENSFCPHYVTEKFFRKFGGFETSVDIITVVRGGTDYRKYFPDGTFINTDDFRSPKELAIFLKTLGANVEAYAAMLKRKSVFRTNRCVKKDAWCKLCDMLHDTHMKSHIYEDLGAWWDKEACLDIKDVTDIKK